MVRRRKDSSSEIYAGLIRMVSITITSNITLVLLSQLVLYMAQQYRQGSRVMKNLYRGVELLSRNQTSAFLGRENHLATRMSYEEALNFLQTMPVLERFVVLICDHTSRSQRVTDARNVLPICAEEKNPWDLLSTDHALFQYTKRVDNKDGNCWGQCFEWGRSRES